MHDLRARAAAIFREVLDLDPERRASSVALACAGESDLRREVDSLLAAHALATGFLEGSPPRVAADGAPVAERPELAPGTILGDKYRVDAMLASGGMGAVYAATQLTLDRAVAIKVVDAALVADGGSVERFEREALILARLRHPHVVTIHDFGFAPGAGAFIVMERLSGRTLRAEIDAAAPLDADRAEGIVGDVCLAVGAAHAAGIVHRDLKPENVFLEAVPEGSRVKVLDFGIARSLVADPALGRTTAAGAIMGTPAYMSPEQCRGDETDERSDVYALGCVLFELLTARPPFVADSTAGYLYKHVWEPAPRASSIVPGVPRRLDAVLAAALAKDPDDRFSNARAFGAALRDGARASRERSLDAPTNRLPVAATSFVGRRDAVADLGALTASARLVTLVGPGGIGKTRLALEVAATVAGRSPDGVRLAELVSVRDPSGVPAAIAVALGLPEEPGVSPTAVVVRSLAASSLLLVVDNCEHVLDETAAFAAVILRTCPDVRILATSREPLGVAGEVVRPVPPLTVPDDADLSDPAALGRSEAVGLFVERAKRGRPAFELTAETAPAVAEICRVLEGIPLAIELAAARVLVLSVEQIVARLDDRFRLLAAGPRSSLPHHRTLRAAVDWSFDLLSDDERATFSRVSIFVGGWTLAAAEAVVAAGGAPAGDALDLLAALVDKSLVETEERRGEVRFRMLETLRLYAHERLVESGEAAELVARHATYFLDLAERASTEILGAEPEHWLSRVDDDHDNLRAVLSRAGAGTRVQLAGALGVFWVLRGRVTEGRAWLEAAIGDDAHARPDRLARALYWAAFCADVQSEFAAAAELFARAVSTARACGEAAYLARSLRTFGHLLQKQNDLDGAVRLIEESRSIAAEIGEGQVEAQANATLGLVALSRGRFDDATRAFVESLAAFRRLGRRRDSVITLLSLAEVARYAGDVEGASAYLDECATLAEALDDAFVDAELRSIRSYVATERGAHSEARRLQRSAFGIFKELREQADLAELLTYMAHTAAAGGDDERAIRMLGTADALRAAIGVDLTPNDRAVIARDVGPALARVGPERARVLLAEGRATSPDEALD